MPRIRPAEPKRSLSIYLPNSLYLELGRRVGKESLNAFINQVLVKELANEKEQLRQQLIKGYQTQAKNKKLQEELGEMEETQFEDSNNEQKSR